MQKYLREQRFSNWGLGKLHCIKVKYCKVRYAVEKGNRAGSSGFPLEEEAAL